MIHANRGRFLLWFPISSHILLALRIVSLTSYVAIVLATVKELTN